MSFNVYGPRLSELAGHLLRTDLGFVVGIYPCTLIASYLLPTVLSFSIVHYFLFVCKYIHAYYNMFCFCYLRHVRIRQRRWTRVVIWIFPLSGLCINAGFVVNVKLVNLVLMVCAMILFVVTMRRRMLLVSAV
jgi:hypothetical protein